MLELKNICKTYRPKNGPEVQALKSVSVKFPEKGLVFFLGKSGCGKSTLLNCIGGLDKFDSGEIIIKGKSSKEFTGSDFDSYRNTFIGFIFQEYNILSEFNIEKNIALALELQGKKADKKAVDEILEMVDLKEFGKRKTTELSGGQKQRVAIARALIKEPEIIVADEPTGALDSATGIQVFDTLKKLAQNKLVIVVSHDREFAEIYGDRIIEMKDGVIISDETKRKVAPNSLSDDLTIIGEDLIHIKKGHKFTQDEKDMIIKFLESRDTETIISVDEKKNQKFKQVAKIDDSNHTEKFTATTEEDKESKVYDKEKFKLIKSKLKWKDAFKMGASSLKSKPVRLVFTILLSVVAFIMFGLVDTVTAYDKVGITVQSIMDSKITDLAYMKEAKEENKYTYFEDGVEVEEIDYYWNDTLITGTDIAKLNREYGLNLKGVYAESGDTSYSLSNSYKSAGQINTETSYLTGQLSGFLYESKKSLEDKGFTVYGDMPANEGEIAITEWTFKHFTYAGFRDAKDYDKTIDANKITKDYNAETGILGRFINLNNEIFKIVGVVDTKFDYDKYSEYDPSERDDKVGYSKREELKMNAKYSYHSVVFTTETYLSDIALKGYELYYETTDLQYGHSYFNTQSNSYGEHGEKDCKILASEYASNANIHYFNGYENVATNGLANNQVILDISLLFSINSSPFYDNAQLSDISIAMNGQNMRDYLTAERINAIKGLKNEIFKVTEDTYSSYDRTKFYISKSYLNTSQKDSYTAYEVVGFYVQDGIYYSKDEDVVIVNDSSYASFSENKYAFAIGNMPTDEAKLTTLVESHYASQGKDQEEKLDSRFVIMNSVTNSMIMASQFLEPISEVLIWVGLGFALFAALMLMNFISTSISYKKREIGILRAIGARKKDVFSIFYNESLVIALINFVLASIGTGVVVGILNTVLREEMGMILTLLNFSIRQVILIFGVSILVAILASLLPVYKIAKKQPIDAINNR